MSLPAVTSDQILNAVQRVPTARWGDALRAIENLQSEPGSTAVSASMLRTGCDLHDSVLIGIWTGRDDVTNNHQFARELRRQAEHRQSE
jgi:hypothetical protein